MVHKPFLSREDLLTDGTEVFSHLYLAVVEMCQVVFNARETSKYSATFLQWNIDFR